MARVELVFFHGCPNVELARKRLSEALRRRGRLARWDEWDLARESVPAYVTGYGSPTVLIDGHDVLGTHPTEGRGLACRAAGAPETVRIEEALRRAERGPEDEAPGVNGPQ